MVPQGQCHWRKNFFLRQYHITSRHKTFSFSKYRFKGIADHKIKNSAIIYSALCHSNLFYVFLKRNIRDILKNVRNPTVLITIDFLCMEKKNINNLIIVLIYYIYAKTTDTFKTLCWCWKYLSFYFHFC